MASTTKTTNLELSQFVGTDKPAWLTDYNGDMQKIDDGYKKLEDANTATQADLNATKQDLNGSQTDIADIKADVQALEAQDIALGNRLTVVEGNYDTIHHEVAINTQNITDLKTAVNKWLACTTRDVTPTSAVAGSHYSKVVGNFNDKEHYTLFILSIDMYDVTVTTDTELFDLSSLFVPLDYVNKLAANIAALEKDTNEIGLVAINIDDNYKVKATVTKGTGVYQRISGTIMFITKPL